MATTEKMQSHNVKLPESTWKKLKHHAAEREQTVGGLIRYIVKQYLNGAK